jgi:uncharacterized membrane protein
MRVKGGVDMSENNLHASPKSTALLPGVSSCYKHGWRQLWKYFLELLLIIIIAIIISLPSGLGQGGDRATAGAIMLSFFALVYRILVGGPVDYGMAFAYLKAARGDEPKVKDTFEAFHNYWNAVLANLLVGAIIIAGLVLFIIPGIIFACKLIFTPYLVVDQNMEVIDAVKESWYMTRGYAWTVFLIGLLAIPICIAGLLCLGVGIIVALMWIQLTVASLYHAVSAPTEVPAQA